MLMGVKHLTNKSVDKPARRAASRQRQNLKRSRDQPRTFRGSYIVLLVTLDVAYLRKKFDDSSFIYS